MNIKCEIFTIPPSSSIPETKKMRWRKRKRAEKRELQSTTSQIDTERALDTGATEEIEDAVSRWVENQSPENVELDTALTNWFIASRIESYFKKQRLITDSEK